MPHKRTAPTPGILCATALTLTLALTGCGGQTESPAPAGDEASAEKTDDSASVEMSDQAAEMVKIIDEMADKNDTTGAEEFDSVPTEDDEQVGRIENADEIDTGEDDASKAPSGTIRLMGHGVQMLIPDTWFAMNSNEGIQFFNREGTIVGTLADQRKRGYETIDVEQLVKAIPLQLKQSGYQDVRVVSQDSGYSGNGTLCAASICVLVNPDGEGDLTLFVQFVESKSYLTRVVMEGTKDDFAASIDDINSIVNSLQFNNGEAI